MCPVFYFSGNVCIIYLNFNCFKAFCFSLRSAHCPIIDIIFPAKILYMRHITDHHFYIRCIGFSRSLFSLFNKLNLNCLQPEI